MNLKYTHSINLHQGACDGAEGVSDLILSSRLEGVFCSFRNLSFREEDRVG